MIATICALSVLLAQEAKKEILPSQLELAHHKVLVLDPLFIRVTLTNTTKQRVSVSTDTFTTTHCSIESIVDPFRCTYYYHSFGCPSGSHDSVPIASGETVTVDYRILELPPAQFLTDEIWRRILRGRPTIFAHVYGEKSEVPIQTRSQAAMFLRNRPPEEMEFLSALYAEMLQRKEKNESMPKGFDHAAPQPGNFGLGSFWPYPDLVEKLVAYEERLSPGSLRDVVHTLAVMRKLYYSKNQAEDERVVNEFLQWLDTLPEIERHCLAGRITSNMFCATYRDEPALNHLIYELIQRRPERLYTYQDYRTTQLNQFVRHPGFQAYLEQRKSSDPKE